MLKAFKVGQRYCSALSAEDALEYINDRITSKGGRERIAAQDVSEIVGKDLDEHFHQERTEEQGLVRFTFRRELDFREGKGQLSPQLLNGGKP